MESQGSTARPMAQRPRPLPVLVLADVSGSMAEAGKIDVLNRSVATMIRSFAAEDSVRGQIVVGVVTFGGEQAVLHQPPVPAARAHWQDMQPFGRTPLGSAFDLATALLVDDTIVPRRAFLPTLVLVSDGIPTDEWREPLDRLLGSERGGKAIRLAVGVGRDMDEDSFSVLREFVANPALPVVRADEIHRVSQFFGWVTMTVTTRVRSGQLNTPAPATDLLDFLS